jgi:hypothetical protein
MLPSILERVRNLRIEIAELKKANELFNNQKGGSAESDRERRKQRLQEIQAEITAMTQWKKT